MGKKWFPLARMKDSFQNKVSTRPEKNCQKLAEMPQN